MAAPGRDRRLVLVCAVIALFASVIGPLLGVAFIGTLASGGVVSGVVLLGLVPSCAALAAVVLTRVPWVGLGIAASAAVVENVVGLGAYLASDWSIDLAGDIGVTGSVGIAFTGVLAALALLAADLLARRVDSFSALSGALAGAVVAIAGILLEVVASGWVPVVVGPSPLFLLTTVALPALLLTLTGSLSGAAASRRDTAELR